jgi:dipeptidyl aminopeptidase/acylaminoacyl peptidase
MRERPHGGVELFRVSGKRMLALTTRPAGPEGKRFPAVLFLHGFPGSEKSVDVQRALLARGVASVAPHFLGAWGSEGTYRFTTLVAQSRAALAATRRLPFVDPRRLAVYGFSMGGWAALNLAALEPALKAVVAVAPVGGPEMVGPRTEEFMARLSRPLRAAPPRAMARDFAAAVARHDPARAVARLKTPLLLVHGTDDDTVPILVSRRLAAAASGPLRFVVEKGASHDFLERRDKLARLCAPWLASKLR